MGSGRHCNPPVSGVDCGAMRFTPYSAPMAPSPARAQVASMSPEGAPDNPDPADKRPVGPDRQATGLNDQPRVHVAQPVILRPGTDGISQARRVATHAGHKALSHAETMELAALSLSHKIEGSDRNVEGPPGLTGLDAIFDAFIIARLPRLLASHPGQEITFSTNLELLDLSRREADIALRNREPTHLDSVGRRLGRVGQAAYAAAGLELGEAPPLIALPRENDGMEFSKILRDLLPRGRIAARGNSEGHILALALARADICIGILDCFVGDSDPSLRRVLSYPVASQIVWAEAMSRWQGHHAFAL